MTDCQSSVHIPKLSYCIICIIVNDSQVGDLIVLLSYEMSVRIEYDRLAVFSGTSMWLLELMEFFQSVHANIVLTVNTMESEQNDSKTARCR